MSARCAAAPVTACATAFGALAAAVAANGIAPYAF